MNNKRQLRSVWTDAKTIVRTLWICLAVLWTIEIVDAAVFHGSLDGFGLKPRDTSGLLGILTAPLLHGGFGHLVSNTIGFVIFGGLVALVGRREFWMVTLVGWLSGLGVWVIGAQGVHIGASGVIFAYFGFLLLRGWYQRRIGSIALSLVLLWTYGSLLWGMIPWFAPPNVSWEGHLCGFLGGVLVASWAGKKTPLATLVDKTQTVAGTA